jgi:hypothetical protein
MCTRVEERNAIISNMTSMKNASMTLKVQDSVPSSGYVSNTFIKAMDEL